MTSVLSPVLSETTPLNQVRNLDARKLEPLPKQDTREYLADMLKELSSIAAWAELERAQKLIEAALFEVEGHKGAR